MDDEVRQAILKGYDAAPCPHCSQRQLVRSGDVSACDNPSCGWRSDAVTAGPAPGANTYQVGGEHYRQHGANNQEQHWDRIWRLFGPGYFIGNITKYVERYQDKDGLKDLRKAEHYIRKLIELEEAKAAARSTARNTRHYARSDDASVTVVSQSPPVRNFNDLAAALNLGHWTTRDPASNAVWQRSDGSLKVIDDRAPWYVQLIDFDNRYPVSPKEEGSK